MPRSKYSKGLEGIRFERTVIQSFSHSIKSKYETRYYWNCLCDCGKSHVADARSFFRGYIKSCGCLNYDHSRYITHGHSLRGKITREFTSWMKMRDRCTNPNHEKAEHYIGRGIRFCEGFKEFSHFLNILGSRPIRTSLDRRNNDGNYSCGQCTECVANQWPLNVRWATQSEQNRNRRPRAAVALPR